MMAGNLSKEQRKWILKQYWKTGNAERVRTAWVEAFNTIYCIPTYGPPCMCFGFLCCVCGLISPVHGSSYGFYMSIGPRFTLEPCN